MRIGCNGLNLPFRFDSVENVIITPLKFSFTSANITTMYFYGVPFLFLYQTFLFDLILRARGAVLLECSFFLETSVHSQSFVWN